MTFLNKVFGRQIELDKGSKEEKLLRAIFGRSRKVNIEDVIKNHVYKNDPYQDEFLESDVLVFTKDFKVNDIFTVHSGEKYFFSKDGNHFTLYNVHTRRKELRLKISEVETYCEKQEEMAGFWT